MSLGGVKYMSVEWTSSSSRFVGLHESGFVKRQEQGILAARCRYTNSRILHLIQGARQNGHLHSTWVILWHRKKQTLSITERSEYFKTLCTLIGYSRH